MTTVIVPIVEGETEQDCLPGLLRRVWVEQVGSADTLIVPRCVLAPIGSVRNRPGYFEQRLALAAGELAAVTARLPSRGAVLVLLDADADGCRLGVGADLTRRAAAAAGHLNIVVALAVQELENWIVAAAESLAGRFDFPADMAAPPDPEARKGSSWLTTQRKRHDRKRRYTKPDEAKALFSHLDLAAARSRAPSLDRLCRKLAGLAAGPA